MRLRASPMWNAESATEQICRNLGVRFGSGETSLARLLISSIMTQFYDELDSMTFVLDPDKEEELTALDIETLERIWLKLGDILIRKKIQ